MITRVIKRDGREVVFNIEKIANAIHKALDATAETSLREASRPRSQTSMELATRVAERIDATGQRCPTIEYIQDTVEQILMESGFPETAKRYILYRSQRTRVREMKTHLMQTFHAMNPLATPDTASTASGKNRALPLSPFTASDHLQNYGRTGASSYNLLYVLSPTVSQAHQNLDFFIHDLEYYTLTYADQAVDLKPLFAGGFQSGQAVIRQPSDIRSFAALAGVAVASIREEVSGSVYLTHFDRVLAEGVQATHQRLTDKYRQWLPADQATELAERETTQATYQAMDAFLHQMNTSSLRLQPGHSASTLLYGLETDASARLAVRQLLEATLRSAESSPKGRAGILDQPHQIFRLAAGVNLLPGDPNHDLFQLACQCCAQTGQPGFALADPVQTTLATVTINLPRCAILARNDLNLFYHRLEQQLSLAIESLLERYRILQTLSRGKFPFLAGQIFKQAEPLDSVDSTLASDLTHGSLAVGFAGLAETLTSLIGRHHGQSREALNLGLEIVGMLRQTCADASEQHGIDIHLMAVDDPQVLRQFADADRQQLGQIAGVTSHSSYTPGFSLPCRPDIGIADRIRIEAPYHQLVQAGRILEFRCDGDSVASAAAIEAIVKQAADAGLCQVILSPPK